MRSIQQTVSCLVHHEIAHLRSVALDNTSFLALVTSDQEIRVRDLAISNTMYRYRNRSIYRSWPGNHHNLCAGLSPTRVFLQIPPPPPPSPTNRSFCYFVTTFRENKSVSDSRLELIPHPLTPIFQKPSRRTHRKRPPTPALHTQHRSLPTDALFRPTRDIRRRLPNLLPVDPLSVWDGSRIACTLSHIHHTAPKRTLRPSRMARGRKMGLRRVPAEFQGEREKYPRNGETTPEATGRVDSSDEQPDVGGK